MFASSASTTAFTGGKPNAAIIAAVIAIGDSPPATPSSNAPKANAISSACSRRSSLNPASTRLIESNRPVATVTLWKYTAWKAIQATDQTPNTMPIAAESSASPKGMR